MIVDIKDRSPNESAVGILKKLLAQAEAGELRTFVAIAGWSEDGWTNHWCIDPRNSTRRLIGQFSLMQFDLLTKASMDNDESILHMALNGQ